MHNLFTIPLFLLLSVLLVTAQAAEPSSQQLTSPDGSIEVTVEVRDAGVYYSVQYKKQAVIQASRLGFDIQGQPQLAANLEVTDVQRNTTHQAWQQVWGERAEVVDHHNQLSISLQEREGLQRKLELVFRAFDDGIGFRYHLPQQPNLQEFAIEDELTEFALAQNYHAWWIPAYRDQRYEYQYLKSALSSIDVAHTPLTLTDDGIAIAIHEAALVDYASMTLRNVSDNHKTLKADLVPWADGTKVYAKTPLTTPWRTIQIASQAAELINSDLIVNLNEPNRLGDTSAYVKPGKYMGVWWEMHIGSKSWSPGADQGATTERVKEYIDFAAEHDIDGVLVEGWNKGWEGEWWQRKPTFIFDEPVVGFDIQAAVDYASSKGRQLVGHHETAAGIAHYEAQMERAFAYYQKLGIHSVKMGYVGTRLEGKEWHHGQFMVRHFAKVVATAAKYQVMVNAHETIKDTGLRRTYPNLMTRECVRGMEYNGGSPDTGNLPNHTVIIPFTRGLAGPTDFTPGIFNFDYQEHRPYNRVPTTLAKQLALYVTLYSPLQMAADLPENYQGHPAFQFIDDVPTDWQESRALQGEIGEFLVIARKDRHSEDWYLGATSNETPRQLSIKLDFLDAGRYQATIYRDGEQAHWRTNPEDYVIESKKVKAGQVLKLDLKPGGGAAVRLHRL
ncbi:glycoside hydrolase family 97 protein [Pseudomaricurvus alcaniphilus]|uniref:glycoside hydrolase family 97 protein n=1 Tax=Pseudomaricurvus alcaniphilus TaxID=1166482 RepID=UPI0014099923|nr:glycoside hydrolase family 97 protein [Pseudomaricurvus alcaniphilus]NHN37359.1 glycoside hydrolase family 97 protein [Pseudomaricurvus alcaniphilus]